MNQSSLGYETSDATASAAVREATQMPLWGNETVSEDPAYLSKQLLTYIGNKRALLGQVGVAVERVKRRLGKDKLSVLDGFSGSGVVGRFLKAHASSIVSNDLEDYAAVIARCYLRNRSTVDWARLSSAIAELNASVESADLAPGFISELYAARDEAKISHDDRVFYTQQNARRLDNYRRLIDGFEEEMRDLLLGPLLSKASIHANTAGVFKGFYKDRHTKRGCFGGTGADALSRITSKIVMEAPVLSRFECESTVIQGDANAVLSQFPDLDLAYIDPPYNQHPYGSNYFMLNLLVNYQRPAEISRVSGIPVDWKRSGYNVRSESASLLRDLLERIDSRFLLVSFNDEGFIPPASMHEMLAKLGSVETLETRYNTFRGSRNLRNRNIHVTEHLFLVERD